MNLQGKEWKMFLCGESTHDFVDSRLIVISMI